MEHGLDLGSLRVFNAVCQNASMSAAARQLGITQPAVSTIVQRLERSLGVELFERNTRPLRLTDAGRVLKDRALEIEAAVSALSQDLHLVSHHSIPNLRLACSDPVSVSIGPYLIESLLSDVKHITMTTGQTFKVCQSFLRNEVDMVISADSMRYAKAVNVIPIFSEDYLVLTPEALNCQINEINDLFRLPKNLVFVAGNFRTYDTLQTLRIFRYYELYEPEKTRLELETESILMHLVSTGQCWGILSPMEIWKSKDYFKNIRIHVLEPLKRKRTVYLLYKDAAHQPMAKAIASRVKAILRDRLLPDMKSRLPGLVDSVSLSENF